jgi:hypothetical protein
MRRVIAATLLVAAGLIAASMRGVATAEAPTVPPQRTVSVEGVATEAIAQAASAPVATGIYHQGIVDAVADGQAKAQLIASRVGTTLGPVQSVVEGGGFIQCAGSGEPGSNEYEGAQPDFGSPGTPISATRGSAGAARPKSRKPASRRGKSPAAKKATVLTCTLSAQVALVYPLG